MIRKAQEKDIKKIGELLSQVNYVHYEGRPDVFKLGRKYSDEELCEILRDEARPVLVSTDERDEVMGYCFCIITEHNDSSVLNDIKTLYIDDLCVDETLRSKGVGRQLYEAALKLAREKGCYNLTLNVWSCNPSALRFYESCGLTVQKIGMEKIL